MTTFKSKKNEPAVEGPREVSHNTTMDQTYRVHFSCENTGRYIRTSKRRIRWVFGFKRSNADEEHDVELNWSVKSGKTRIVWNQCLISSILREGGDTEIFEFTWKTQSNDVLKVIAHSFSSGGEVRQYDLWVNGVRFSQLLTLSELVRRKRNKETRILSKTIEPQRSEERRRRRVRSSFDSDTSLDFLNEIGVTSSSSSFRLAMAGYQTDSADDEDELRSELYSSALDEVRLSVTSFLPQTEEMISRAIMDVFISNEDDTGHHSSSSSLYVPRDEECCHHEVNALYETLEWIRLHYNKEDESPEEEMVLAFLQQKFVATIRQIRSEQISSHTAIRILLGVASLLDIPSVRPMVQDTVMVENCHDLESGQLREFLSRYGEVEWCRVSERNPSFACCRFREEDSLMNLLKAFRDNRVPKFSHVSFRALSNRTIPSAGDLSSSRNGRELVMEKPRLIKSISHDQQTASSSTCASPQSQCSILDLTHFVLE